MEEYSAARRWFTAAVLIASLSEPAVSGPETNQLNKGCSQYNATDAAGFSRRLNSAFADLRNQLLSVSHRQNNSDKHFATTGPPVYAMVQCRNYLSAADCVACYDAAVAAIRSCSSANGGRVIFDGCFLRYESNNFYDQTTLPGNLAICSNRTALQRVSFNATVEQLLNDLQVATPKIDGFFAATKRVASGGSSGGATAYAVAQCAETISKSGCQDCLAVAYKNIQGCLSKSAEGRAVDAACFLRYSDTPFFAEDHMTNLEPFLGRGSSGKKKAIIIGCVVGGIGLVLVFGVIFLLYQRSNKLVATKRGNISGATELRGPEAYKYKDLKAATKDFCEENKLGEGGFGGVYKGVLRNGDVVAVKKLAMVSSRAKADFDSEVKLITNVHHRNLIRLLGCSSKGDDLLLVYEYMANGSLDKYLYGEKRGTLNWKQRFDIIFGTARGLAYLHDEFHVCIIHRDIKSSNILLDNSFQPKIADFGLARLLPENQSHLSTRFAGTLGYTAPEYALHGHLSEKVDTYSFGVVVLEIVSGRRSGDVQLDTENEYLLAQAWNVCESGNHLKLMDESLDPNDYTPEDATRIVEIALMCTQSPPNRRPSMSQVVVMLSSDPSTIHSTPQRPSIIDFDKSTSTPNPSTTSNATASFSHATGR